jgi:hypothetical protein
MPIDPRPTDIPPRTVRRSLAGTGSSRSVDAAIAGREAALAAIAPLHGEPPALVLVFTTPRYDLPVLIDAIRAVTGPAQLAGCTSSGEIAQGEYLGFGEGVAVLALTAGPYRFGVASADYVRADLDAAGRRLTTESRALAGDSPHAAAFLLTDSLLGDLQQFVHGVYRVTGPKAAIVGGGAGDEQRFIRTLVFHDGRILDEGAVVVWIASERPLRVVTRHGWQPIGIPVIVTRAQGTEILELGGRQAAEVYEEQLGLEPGALPPEKFWGTSILHPFGLLQPDDTTIIRVARAKTSEGALRIQGCVPPAGSAVQVMSGSTDTLIDVAEEVVAAALEDNHEPAVLLTFSCAARAMIFGARAPEEARRLQTAAGAVPTFGFYCCAEFARTSGVLATHNATLTAMAL